MLKLNLGKGDFCWTSIFKMLAVSSLYQWICKLQYLLHCRIESGAEASSSNSHSPAANAAAPTQMYPPEQLGRNNNQTSCICGRTDVGGITIQCEVMPLVTTPTYD